MNGKVRIFSNPLFLLLLLIPSAGFIPFLLSEEWYIFFIVGLPSSYLLYILGFQQYFRFIVIDKEAGELRVLPTTRIKALRIQKGIRVKLNDIVTLDFAYVLGDSECRHHGGNRLDRGWVS